MAIQIETEFSQRATAFGVPRRVNRQPFELKDVLESYTLGNKFRGERQQEKYYKSALKEDTGWIMYLGCESNVETGRLIAANIVAYYDAKRSLRSVWQNLGNTENLKPAKYPHLVVIDGYFDDSPAWRRDRIYDLMTYHHDRPETSIIVIGKTISPSYMAKVIGIRPNFPMWVTK